MKIKLHGSLQHIVSYLIVLLMSGMVLLSLNKSSFGVVSIFLAFTLLLLNLNWGYLNDVAPAMLFCLFVLVMLAFSGQASERGFNAPINNAMKFVYLFLAYSMSVATRKFSKPKKRSIVIVSFIVAAISSVISIYYAVCVDKYAIRYYSARGFTQVADFNQLYGFTVLFVLVVFAFLSLSIQGQKLKWLMPVALCIVVCIGVSLYTTAVLLTAIGICLALLFLSYHKSRKKTVILLAGLVVLLMLVLLFGEQISDWIYDATSEMNWIVRDRLRSVADTIFRTDHNLAYSYDRRNELASYSLETFKANPVIGVGYKKYGYGVIGCHQEWYDVLGVFGIVGTLILSAIFAHIVRMTWKTAGSKIDRYAFSIALLMFFVLGFLNPCINLPVLIAVFIIAPNISVLGDEFE